MKYSEMPEMERNKLVQELIMGGLQCDGNVEQCYKDDSWECIKCRTCWNNAPKSHEIPDRCIPAYGTDMNAAWMIVEKLRERNLGVSLYTGEGDYFVQVWNRQISDLKSCGSSSNSMPEAIREAALRACGVEIE